MAFSPLAAGQGVAGALSNYGKSPSQKSDDTKKEPQHRDYQPVLKSKSPTIGPSGGPEQSLAKPHSAKRGGKVKRTGMAKIHRGERVLTKKQARKYESKKKY